MSHYLPTPAPLTAEREAEIRFSVERNVRWSEQANAPLCFSDQTQAELLAELDRTRAATAAELRGLLEEMPPEGPLPITETEWFDAGLQSAKLDYNAEVKDIAARLGITL